MAPRVAICAVIVSALASPAAGKEASTPPSQTPRAVQTQTLSNGVKMPMLALGVYQYNDTQAESAVKAALVNGFSMVDGGQAYGNNAGVGKAVNAIVSAGLRKRKDLWIQAKVDGCGFKGVEFGKCYEDTKAILEQQLVELNQTYVDSAIIHFPPLADMPIGGCRLGICNMIRNQWKAMVEFYKANKTRSIGVSNYCKNCYSCLEDGEFEVLPQIHQIQYHLGMGADKYGYVTFAKEKQMAIQAYSTLANKPSFYFWEPKGINPQILSGNAFNGSLGKIAKSHNVSTIQVALKWVVQHGFTALTKSSNPKHLQSDSDLWSFDLADEEMGTLDYEVPNWPAAGADHGLHGLPAWACHFPGSNPGVAEQQSFVV